MGGHWVPSCPFYLTPCGQGAQSSGLFICQRKPVHLAPDTGTLAHLCHRSPDPLSCQHAHHTFQPAICHCVPVLCMHVCPTPPSSTSFPLGKATNITGGEQTRSLCFLGLIPESIGWRWLLLPVILCDRLSPAPGGGQGSGVLTVGLFHRSHPALKATCLVLGPHLRILKKAGTLDTACDLHR